MKLIFLDIDGVLNRKGKTPPTSCEMDAEKLALVAELVRKSGAEIVLTSSWRLSADATWQTMLSQAGISVFGKTARLNGNNRQKEILAYLVCREDVEGFVILDDQYGRWGRFKSRLVRTNPNEGLTERHIQRALDILSRNPPFDKKS